MDAILNWLAAGMSAELRYQLQGVSADAKEVFCSEDRRPNLGEAGEASSCWTKDGSCTDAAGAWR